MGSDAATAQRKEAPSLQRMPEEGGGGTASGDQPSARRVQVTERLRSPVRLTFARP